MGVSNAAYVEIVSLSDGPDYTLNCRMYENIHSNRLVTIPIDAGIYRQLINFITFSENVRYRLSLNLRWDPFLKQKILKVTQLGTGYKKNLYLTCPADYTLVVLSGSGKQKEESPSSPAPTTSQVQSVTKKTTFRLGRVSYLFAFYLFFLLVSVASALSADMPLTYSAGTKPALSPVPEPGTAQTGAGAESEAFLPAVEEPVVAEPIVEKPVLDITELELETNICYALPEGYVALTFDDGPSEYTKQIVDILLEQQVAATFFFVGRYAVQHQDAVKYAADSQMSVQSHSWSHADFSRLTPQQQKQEIEKTSSLLESLTKQPVTLFRPPYGAQTKTIRSELAKRQMKMVMWNRDPRDWEVNNANSIYKYFTRTDPSGSVYILHENRYTVEALPDIIRHLKEKELQFAVLR